MNYKTFLLTTTAKPNHYVWNGTLCFVDLYKNENKEQFERLENWAMRVGYKMFEIALKRKERAMRS